MLRSRTMTSGLSSCASSMAMMPSCAPPTISIAGSWASAAITPARTSGWSSATTTRIFIGASPARLAAVAGRRATASIGGVIAGAGSCTAMAAVAPLAPAACSRRSTRCGIATLGHMVRLLLLGCGGSFPWPACERVLRGGRRRRSARSDVRLSARASDDAVPAPSTSPPCDRAAVTARAYAAGESCGATYPSGTPKCANTTAACSGCAVKHDTAVDISQPDSRTRRAERSPVCGRRVQVLLVRVRSRRWDRDHRHLLSSTRYARSLSARRTRSSSTELAQR